MVSNLDFDILFVASRTLFIICEAWETGLNGNGFSVGRQGYSRLRRYFKASYGHSEVLLVGRFLEHAPIIIQTI